MMSNNLKLMTLNINGLNCKRKQKLLFDFIEENNVHIINLQEHNLKDKSHLIDIFYDKYHVFINETINLKGGTAIFIDKNVTNNIIQVEKSSDARIVSVKISVNNKQMHILNIYAPSGSKYHQEREDFFKTQILYYLRNNLSNTILCGDFNCIINIKDKTKRGTCPISKNLKTTINNLKLEDIWNVCNNNIEFTYFRENYGSRIDRIYAGELKKQISSIYVKPVTISDHSCVMTEIDMDYNISLGKFYWKLNIKLLDLENIEDDFVFFWNNLLKLKYKYENINEWWEYCAKVKIKCFFQKKGREESNMKYGLIKYLEWKLHKLYKILHDTGTLDLKETKILKDKINNIKDDILEGVRVRARINEQVEGEIPSSSLLGKQSNNRNKPLISEIKTEQSIGGFKNDIILNSQNNISKYITCYHENLYSKPNIDKNRQEWFLSFIKKSISKSDNDELTK